MTTKLIAVKFGDKEFPLNGLSPLMNVPEELKTLPCWMPYKLVEVDGKQQKRPVDCRSGRPGSKSDPDQRTTFPQALRYLLENEGAADGVGVVVPEGWVCFDFDDALDSDGKFTVSRTRQWVTKLASYTERSVGGKGLHVFVKAVLPSSRNAKKDFGVEIYAGDSGAAHFIAMTGNVFGDHGLVSEDAQDVVDRIFTTVAPLEQTPAPSTTVRNGTEIPDEQIVQELQEDPVAARLWAGDVSGYESYSDAAAAFLCKLRFYTGANEEQMLRLYEDSEMYEHSETSKSLAAHHRWVGSQVAKYANDGGAIHSRYDAHALTSVKIKGMPSAETMRALREQTGSLADLIGAQYTMNDIGNARRLLALHPEFIKYCPEHSQTYVWTGTYWEVTPTNKTGAPMSAQLRTMAVDTSEAMVQAIAGVEPLHREKYAKWAIESGKQQRLSAMTSTVTALKETFISGAEADATFDTQKFLLNVAGGTLNLETGEVHPFSPADHITVPPMSTAYDPDAKAPMWEKFIDDVFQSDQELIEYVQRAIGYSLTSDTREHCFFLLHGAGSNGKSTLLNVLQELLGAYASPVSSAVIVQDEKAIAKSGRSAFAGTGLEMLPNKRCVVAEETTENQVLQMGTLKAATGDTRLVAAHMYGKAFTYTASFKLWFSFNHKPIVKGTDDGTWRRIQLIPFNAQFTAEKGNLDREFTEKLYRELPGILNWAIEGFHAWRRDGLNPPEQVKLAVQEYRAESDLFGEFLSTCFSVTGNPDHHMQQPDVYDYYTAWARNNGMSRTWTSTTMGKEFKKRGFTVEKVSGSNRIFGIRPVIRIERSTTGESKIVFN